MKRGFGRKIKIISSSEPTISVNGRYSLRQNDSDEKLVHFLVPRATVPLLDLFGELLGNWI